MLWNSRPDGGMLQSPLLHKSSHELFKDFVPCISYTKRKEIKKSHYIRNLHTYTRYRNTLTTHIQNKPTSCSMLNDALALSKLGHSPCNSTHMYADRQTHKLNLVHSHMHAHKTNQIFLVLYKTVLSHKVHLYIIYSHLHVNIKFSE